MTEDQQLKEKFAEVAKFQAFYTAGQNIFLSHDGQHVICGCSGEEGVEINVINSEGRLVRKVEATADHVVNFTVSQHDGTLIFASKSQLLTLWNWQTGKVLKRWQCGHSKLVSCLALSPSGGQLAVGSSDRKLRLWRLTPGAEESDPPSAEALHAMACGADMPTAAKFHPRLDLLATVTRAEAAVRVWDTQSGAQSFHLEGHAGEVTAVSFGRCEIGEMLFSCCQGKLVIGWDLASGQKHFAVPTMESLTSCLFIGDPKSYLGADVQGGPYVLTGGQSGVARLWRMEKGRCSLELRRKALEAPPKVPGTKRKLEAVDAEEEEEQKAGEYSLRSITDVVSGPGEHHLVVRASGSIEFYRKDCVRVDHEWISHIGSIKKVAFCGADSSQLLVLPSGSSHLLLYPHLLSQKSFRGVTLASGHRGAVTDLAVVPDGRQVLTGGKDGCLRLWAVREATDAGLQLLSETSAHSARISAVVFAPSGAAAFSASESGALCAWRLQKGRLEAAGAVESAHGAEVNAIAAKEDAVCTASRDKSAKVWSFVSSHLSLLKELRGHSKGVWAASFLQLNNKLLTCSGDATVKLWGLEDSQCLATFDQEGGPVYQALLCSGGRQFICCDQSGIFKLTTIKGHRVVQTQAAHEGRLWSLALTADQSHLVTSSETGELTLWEDVSEATREEQRSKLVETYLIEDKVRSFLQAGKLQQALRFVLQSEMPEKSYSILRKLLLSDQPLDRPLADVIASPELLARLLRYCRAWNAHNRRYVVAKRVLAAILTALAPQQLLQRLQEAGEEPQLLLEGFGPFLERHRARESRFARAALFPGLLRGD